MSRITIRAIIYRNSPVSLTCEVKAKQWAGEAWRAEVRVYCTVVKESRSISGECSLLWVGSSTCL